LLEERAWDWAATYLVPYREYKKMMRDPHINSDYDMAEALEVDIEILQRAVRVYKRQGLDIRRSEE